MVGVITDTDVTEGLDTGVTGITEGEFMVRYHRRRYGRGYPRRSWDDVHSLDPESDYYFPYGWVGAGFYAMSRVDQWRQRGEYYDAYYRKTGKRPNRYKYNRLTRRRIKW